jgi:hypothetical protein
LSIMTSTTNRRGALGERRERTRGDLK